MLIPEDREFLERKGWRWDAREVDIGGSHEIHVVIYDYPLPERFQPRSVQLLIRIPPGYPEIGPDMFWTYPDVKEAATGRMPPQAEVHEYYGGQTWQRWSRHMSGWRPGIDNLETFLAAIYKELHR